MLFLIALGVDWLTVPQWLVRPIWINAGIALVFAIWIFLIVLAGDRSDEVIRYEEEYGLSAVESMTERAYYNNITGLWFILLVCIGVFGVPGFLLGYLIIRYI